MKKIAAVLLFLSLAASALAQSNDKKQPKVEPQATPPIVKTGDGDEDVLRVETSLVSIPVSVLDSRSGRFISDLKQADFEIFENNVKQEVGYFGATEQPVTIVLLLDTSPSTKFKIEEIESAAIAFVNQLKQNDSVMVIEFDGDIHVLTKPTNDRKKIQKAIRKADFGSGTALYDAVGYALNDRPSEIAGRKAIVLFTDGVDTQSSRTSSISLREAEAGNAPFYVVRYDTFADVQSKKSDSSDEMPAEQAIGTTAEEYETGKRYLDELSDKTGGKVYAATTNENLAAAFAGIADELRRIYSVGYYPSEAGKVGERRALKVRVTRPNAAVQARDSYIVGESPAKPASDRKRKSRD